MNAVVKKKLCWNCEGSVSLTEEHCPFCGVYLSPTSLSDEASLGGNEEFVHEPPYQIDRESEKDQEYSSPYSKLSNSSNTDQERSSNNPSSSTEEFRQIITPMAMILTGSVFFLFGLVLVLFSKDGTLTLQWKSDYWYVYLAGSLFMLFWGWKTLQLIDD